MEKYFIVDGNNYFATISDVEVGGFVDISEDNFAFSSKQEAEVALAELQAYSDEHELGFNFKLEIV